MNICNEGKFLLGMKESGVFCQAGKASALLEGATVITHNTWATFQSLPVGGFSGDCHGECHSWCQDGVCCFLLLCCTSPYRDIAIVVYTSNHGLNIGNNSLLKPDSDFPSLGKRL